MKHQESMIEQFNRVLVPKITAVGSSIVIVGALFKIQHYSGASIMLIVGLLTEATIFFLGVFQPAPPPEKYYNWEKVYPELDEDTSPALAKKDDKKSLAAIASVDKLIGEAGLSADTFKNFGEGIEKLNSSVTQIKDISNISAASNQYTKNLQQASGSITTLTQSFGAASSGIDKIARASEGAQEYHQQVQSMTRNIGALNAVYEMELKDANSHLKAMNKFYLNLTNAMENMSDASKESAQFKNQVADLTTNLTQLNKVYGNMLAAMKS